MGCIYRRTKLLPDGARIEVGPWWISYYRNGKQHHESSGSTTKSDAKDLLKQREGDIVRGVPVSAKVNQLRYEKARDHYLTHTSNNLQTGHAEVDKRRERQFKKTKQRIANYLTKFFSGRRMVAITPPVIEQYKAERRAAKASPATINRELQLLRRMFSLCVQAGMLYHKPHIQLLTENNVRIGFFDDDEIAAVLKHLPEALQPVVEFGWRTGWRIASEVLPLEWRQVDFNAGEVRLDPGQTKNGEGRVIKMTPELRALLEKQRAKHDAWKKKGRILPYVFFREVPKGKRDLKSLRRPREPRRITTFGKAWKKACRLAGCPGRIPHDLRRTAVRNFVRAGVPERVAMRLTGHKTPSVFNRYNIVSEGDLNDAAQRMAGRHVVNH